MVIQVMDFPVHHLIPSTMTAFSEDPAEDLTNAGRLSFLFAEPLDVSGGTTDLVSTSSYQGICEDVSCSTFSATDIVQSGRVTTIPTAPVFTNINDVTVNGGHTGVVIDLEASDANGDSEGTGLTYSLEGIADDVLFNIDQVTGELSFITRPDFNNPLDGNGDNIYIVGVFVTDSGGTSSGVILFNITVEAVMVQAKVYLQVGCFKSKYRRREFNA